MKKSRPYVVISIIAILVFLIAYLIKPDTVTNDVFFYDALLNVAFIIATVVVISLLWFLLGGDPTENLIKKLVEVFDLLSDGFKTGLVRYFTSSSNYAKPTEWLKLLSDSKKQVDMMGYSLHVWTKTDEFSKILINLAKKGVKIRILIMDCQNPHFCAGLNFKQIKSISLESMKGEVDTCTQYMASVSSELKKIGKEENFSFTTCTEGLIECQICRMDELQHITPYLYSVNASGSPLFVIKGSNNDAFKKYEEEFDALWALNFQVEAKV